MNKRPRQDDDSMLGAYQLRNDHNLHNIIPLLEDGNIKLFFNEVSLKIQHPILAGSGVFFITIPIIKPTQSNFESLSNATSSIQISVDKKSLIKCFKQTEKDKKNKKTNDITTVICVYSEYLYFKFYNKSNWMSGENKINAMSTDDNDELVEYQPKSMGYNIVLYVKGSDIELLIPPETKELEIKLSRDSNNNSKLVFQSDQEDCSFKNNFKLKDIKDTIEFADKFGEMALKLLKKVLHLFQAENIYFRLDQSNPLSIEGSFSNSKESILFFLAGKETCES